MRSPNLNKFADTASALDRNPIDYEIMGEKAAALGRAGEKAESHLIRLRQTDSAIRSGPNCCARRRRPFMPISSSVNCAVFATMPRS